MRLAECSTAMNREIHLDPNAICEECGAKGAFDFPWAAVLCNACAHPSNNETPSEDFDLPELSALFECESCGAENSYEYPSAGQLCSKCGFIHTDDGG